MNKVPIKQRNKHMLAIHWLAKDCSFQTYVLEAPRNHSEFWPRRYTWKHNVGCSSGLRDRWGPALPFLRSVSRNAEARVPVTICSSNMEMAIGFL